MNYTDEQICAINSRKKNILVSASAGSGKTAVLVERIIKIVTDEKNPVDINKLLAVTFTDAAAIQMKKRIAAALYAQKPTDFIKRQIILLNDANICTLHSFCMKMVRKFFYLADIDPNFRIAQENEIELLKSDVLDKMLEEEYAKARPIFFETVMAYNTDKIQSDDLKKLILDIYDFSRSIPNSAAWLKKCANNFILAEGTKLEETIWWKKLLPHIKNLVEQINYLILDSIQKCHEDFGPEKYLTALEDDKNFVEHLEKFIYKDFDMAHEILKQHNFQKLFSYIKKNSDEIDLDLKNSVQENRKEFKKLIQNLQEKIFFAKSKFILQNIADSYPIMNEMSELVTKFHDAFRQKKLEQNILSFDDLEEFTLKILSKKKILEPFVEILIDEYQDINDVQEKILSLIPCKSKFMVGDVKQSIYGFRNSSPQLFIQKYNTYGKIADTAKIDLSANFRSVKQITDSVNFLFSRLMTKKFCGLDYSDEKFNTESSSDKTEIFLMNDDKAEVQFICDKIKLLLQNELCKNFSDIAILVRNRSNLKLLTEIFSQNNIPIDTENNTNFFELPEIIILTSFLKIIDNPQNEIPLTAVLRSQIYNVSDDELLKIRMQSSEKSFYDCVKNYDGLEKFKADLNFLRQKKICLSISKLIDEILHITDFFYLAGFEPQQKNIIKFINIAKEYEKTNYQGLFNFIRYLEKISQVNINSSHKNFNAVKIMTIHKSKGLEFPIVFISFLGKNFNMKNLNDKILLDKDLGFGNKFIDVKRRTKINTIAKRSIEFELRQKNLAEEMRLLYVAMTRAKNKLILTGCQKNFSHSFENAAKSFLDWILPIANEKNSPFELQIYENDEKNILLNENFVAVPIVHVDEKIKNQMQWKYPYDISVKAKISISEDSQKNFAVPKFLKSSQISPTQRGQIIHTVLQHLNLNLLPQKNIVNDFLNSLASKNMITDDEQKIVPINKLIKFLESDLFYKMKNSSFIKRETPFILGIENKNDSEKTLIHGIIDCFFEYDGKLYLVDYKTDRVSANEAENFAQKYYFQLKIYKEAIEKNYNRQVDFSIIYLFDIDKAIYF